MKNFYKKYELVFVVLKKIWSIIFKNDIVELLVQFDQLMKVKFNLQRLKYDY